MTDFDSQAAVITGRYMRAQDSLATVRDQVLASSAFVRDALVDAHPGTLDVYRSRFEASYDTCDRMLRNYVPLTNSRDERQHLDELRRNMDQLHEAVLAVFATPPNAWPRDAASLARERVGPDRDSVAHVLGQLQALNRATFVEQRTHISDLNDKTERWAWARLGFGLAIIGIIGLGAAFYAARLEKRIRRQQARDRKTAEELQRLSTRLLTAQEDERRAIARELHDEVGQALTAAKMELAIAAKAMASAPESAARLDEARRTVDDSARIVRDLSHLLHPSLLDDLGLLAALRHQLDSFARRHGLTCDLRDINIDTRLTPEIETTIYRIVQEALSNVVKHAQANHCRVSIRGRSTTVRLTIEDDGSGFDPLAFEALAGSRGLGLIGIRERVAQFGGAVHLTSAAGQGTRLEIELPVHPHASATLNPENTRGGEAANLSW